MVYEEKTVGKESIYAGRIINVEKLSVELPGGHRADREVVRHSAGVVCIPISDDWRICMVEQYRIPFDCTMLELPAGKMDIDGETPLDAAVRELKEETGYTADSMTEVVRAASSPGFCDEILHVFAARGLHKGEAEPDEDEFLDIKHFGIDELLRMIKDGKIRDAKSVIGIYYAALLKAKIINQD